MNPTPANVASRAAADAPAPTVSASPRPTWILMALAVIVTLALPDWADTGVARPLFVLPIPVLLGLAGAFVALRRGHPVWGLVSAAWGFVLVWGLFVVVTLIAGP